MESGVVVVKDMASQQDADKILAAVLGVWGVSRAEVNFKKSEALFTFDERMASPQDFAQAIIDTGYQIDMGNISKENLNLPKEGEANENL